MPTPLDKALNSKNLFVGFAALVTAATAWSIWGQDMFPTSSPSSKPEDWTEAELRDWLEKRNLPTLSTESREDLLARVKNVLSNLR
ncbi:hypothetical protein Slin15195_G108740 [Septoria linicola]|uniref:STE24 endopeptidase n=1 Tax=Septoria linicola TaxID=215465 RepID=A0A9Q9ENY9_9PEZI|nr:hypothetical protein Slin14017_G107040 [Septoria linicola]USW57555.1 hypothetical protein Slin15195_G108740 [Septoria linicola]